jgi:dihydroorotase
LIETLSTRPARIAGVEGGTLVVGAAADITVIDPELDWTVEPSSLCSRSANSPWLNQPVRGRTVLTLVNGEIVFGS